MNREIKELLLYQKLFENQPAVLPQFAPWSLWALVHIMGFQDLKDLPFPTSLKGLWKKKKKGSPFPSFYNLQLTLSLKPNLKIHQIGREHSSINSAPAYFDDSFTMFPIKIRCYTMIICIHLIIAFIPSNFST